MTTYMGEGGGGGGEGYVITIDADVMWFCDIIVFASYDLCSQILLPHNITAWNVICSSEILRLGSELEMQALSLLCLKL